MTATVIPLPTGAEMRLTGSFDRAAVICINGGQSRPVEGTWSATIEWLVRRLAPKFPHLGFAEVRYRIKSWTRFDWCEQDARAAVAETGAPRTLFLGFSMGGAVAVQAADEPGVEGVLGLAPWLPEKLDLGRLRGRRLDVVHGMLDRWLPGIPGVSPAGSRAGFERARVLGIEGSYQLIPGAVHGVAVRSPLGLVPLPRARRWVELAAERIDAWEAGEAALPAGKAA
jgi:pimeloyl-ACP methyl ester carboxylesterase